MDHYFRIEFQHRGSPHAHMIIWLANAPYIDVNSPGSISSVEEFISRIITIDSAAHPEIRELVARQTHKHSHTCKKGESQCRFEIPFFPMDRTRILLPIQEHDYLTDRQLQTSLAKVREVLEAVPPEITTFDEFLIHIGISLDRYLACIQRGLKRPRVCLQRTPQQVLINPFIPKILGLMQSNMDAQFIVDPWACAMYIVDYINKSNRGLSKLLRDAMVECNEGNLTIAEKLKHIGHKFVNASEISSQEAAWCLLHLNMHASSVGNIHISSGPINERVRMAKSRAQLEAEQQLDPTSTAVFNSNLFDHYVQRPIELTAISLAEFAADFEYQKKSNQNIVDVPDEFQNLVDGNEVDMDEALDGDTRPPGHWLRLLDRSGFIRKRRRSKVIKFVRYNFEQDADNFYREQLLLFHPFRNEREEIEEVDHAEVYKTV